MDIRTTLLWLYNIDDVDRVTMELPSGTRVLEFGHVKGPDDNFIGVTAKLDGVDISENNGKRLYGSLLGINISGDAQGEPTGEPTYRFTVQLGTVDLRSTMSLYDEDGRNYAVRLDDQPVRYTVSVRTVEALLQNLQRVDNGEEIPLNS